MGGPSIAAVRRREHSFLLPPTKVVSSVAFEPRWFFRLPAAQFGFNGTSSAVLALQIVNYSCDLRTPMLESCANVLYNGGLDSISRKRPRHSEAQ